MSFGGDAIKAFDRAKRDKMVDHTCGILDDKELAQRIKIRHQNIQAVTEVGGERLVMQVNEGVAQGDPLGSSTYVSGYEGVQNQIDSNRVPSADFSLQLSSDTNPVPVNLSRTMVVDDHFETHLLGQSNQIDILQARLKSIVEPILGVQQEWGIDSNRTKTVLLISLFGKHSRSAKNALGKHLTLSDGTTLPIQRSFKYVGVRVGGTNDGCNEEVGVRIGKANEAMSRLLPICKIKPLSIKTKLQLYNSTVLSILTYGLPQRILSTAQIQRLEALQTRHLRRLGQSAAHVHHESNFDLRTRLEQSSLSTLLLWMRLKWWHKLLLENDPNIRMATEGNEISQGKWGMAVDSEPHDLEIQLLADVKTWCIATKRPIPPNILSAKTTLLTVGKNELRSVKDARSIVERNARKQFGPLNPRFNAHNALPLFCTNQRLQSHRTAAHAFRVPIRQLVVADIANKPRYICLFCKHSYANKHVAQEHVQRVCGPKASAERISEVIAEHESL